MFRVLNAQATWCNEEYPICAINEDGQFSLKQVTKRFCASLKHRNVGQKKFIKPNSQR